jgi:uncharacterized protein YgbK (DUF1537 family)
VKHEVGLAFMREYRKMALQVALIADDLTGALDSAAPFAARGLRARVALSPEAIDAVDPAGLDVLAVTTNSRQIDEAAAQKAVASAALRLHTLAPRVVFKKIDSRIKGHVTAEAQQCAQHLQRPNWLVAPAIPAFGRIVQQGHVEGFGVQKPIDIAARLGRDARIPDIARQEDFAPLVDAVLNDKSLLAIGARGLAEALAERLGGAAVTAPRPASPTLFAIGSVDPITRAQLARLRDHTGRAESLEQDSCGNKNIAILSTPKLVGEIAVAPAQDFARRAARCISALQPNTVVVTGGETAALVLTALDIAHMEVEGETVPGVGQALARTSHGPLRILTKSGGFGSPDTLVEIADLIASGAQTVRVTA